MSVETDVDRKAVSYYPSCVVNLTLRYDEALQVAETPSDLLAATSAKLQSDLVDIQTRALTMSSSQTATDDSATRRRSRLASYSKILAGKIAANNATIASSSSGSLTTLAVRAARRKQAIDDNAKLQQEKDAIDSQLNAKTADAAKSSQPETASIEAVGGNVLVPLGYGGDGFTVITSRVPITGNFVLPHPREAGTFSMTFDFREFPIDPRLLRAVGVEIHVGTVSADDYARGMNGERDTNGRPFSILRTRMDLMNPFTGQNEIDPSTLLMFGAVDRWFVQHGDHSSTIQLEGRDVRGIFIDTKLAFDRLAELDTQQPIDRVVADIIKTMASEHDFQLDVLTNPSEWPNGVVPSPGDVDGLTRVRSGASGQDPKATPANAAGGAGGGGSKVSYWDLITNYCALVGAVPYLKNSGLWIRPARSIFDVLDDTNIPTPFAGGQARQIGDRTIRVRSMVWGRNLKQLSFDRKFAGTIVPIVQAVSIDDRVKGMQRLLVAQWPPADSPQAQTKAASEVLRIPVPGIRDIDRLTEIAHDVYEEIGRGEMGGSAQTINLASDGGSNDDADLIGMRPTDPVEFLVDARQLSSTSPLVSELNDVERRSFEEEVQLVFQRLGDRDIARAIVSSARNAIPELLQYYQVSRVGFDWSSSDGIGVSFDFQNYVVSRHGEAPSVTDTTSDTVNRTRVQLTGQNKKAKHLKFVNDKGTTKLPTSRGASTGRKGRK